MVGGGTALPSPVPEPVKYTFCGPVVSLAVMGQLSRALPPLLGMNVTVSVRLVPAGMVVPSARLVSATKTPRAGGFDLVIVSGLPPTFVSVKLWVTPVPSGAKPKSTLVEEMVSTDGTVATAVTTMSALPPSELTRRSEV
jgi:hypothetical protein